MRRLRPLLLLLGSCLQIGSLDGADGGVGGAGAGAAGAPADAKTTQDRVETSADSNCVVDAASRVLLCTSIALCPGVAVDHDRFPNCGFRGGVGSIDIQCVCGDWLCPLGAALSCAQARDLMETQFEQVACLQASEGRCAPRGQSPPSTPGTCDKNCAHECAGDPGCLRLCGC